MKALLLSICLAAMSCVSIQTSTIIDTSIVLVSAGAGGLLAGPAGAGVAGGFAHLLLSDGDAKVKIEKLQNELDQGKNLDALEPEYYIKIAFKWIITGIGVILVYKYLIANGLLKRTLLA